MSFTTKDCVSFCLKYNIFHLKCVKFISPNFGRLWHAYLTSRVMTDLVFCWSDSLRGVDLKFRFWCCRFSHFWLSPLLICTVYIASSGAFLHNIMSSAKHWISGSCSTDFYSVSHNAFDIPISSSLHHSVTSCISILLMDPWGNSASVFQLGYLFSLYSKI